MMRIIKMRTLNFALLNQHETSRTCLLNTCEHFYFNLSFSEAFSFFSLMQSINVVGLALHQL